MEDVGRALGLLHVLDLILAAVILGMAVYGFSRGTFKLLLIFVSVIAGFIGATIFYIPFTNIIAPFFGLRVSGGGARANDVVVGHSTSFALLLVIIALLIAYLLFSFVGHWEIRGRFQSMFDKPLGMFLGFLAGIIVAAILVTLVSVPYELLQQVGLPEQQGQAGRILHDWYTNSWLGDPLRCGIMPYALGVMSRAIPVPDVLIGTSCAPIADLLLALRHLFQIL